MKKWVACTCLFLILFLSTTLPHSKQAEIRILHVKKFHGFAKPYQPLGSNELLGGLSYLQRGSMSFRKEKPSLIAFCRGHDPGQ